MGKKKVEQQGNSDDESALSSVKFKRKWCAAHRTYNPGDIDELPSAIAKSLEAEGLIEPLEVEVGPEPQE